ncbi:MAG: hypothetical protein U5L01_12775 [Rheinheimera sp.]|nr:hypothetical protein [Rheinheimera sp.]
MREKIQLSRQLDCCLYLSMPDATHSWFFGMSKGLTRISRRSLRTAFVASLLATSSLLSTVYANGNVKVFQYTDKKGNVSFSDRQPLDVPFTLVKFDCFACNVHSTTDWDRIPLFPKHYLREIELAARQHQVDPALIKR